MKAPRPRLSSEVLKRGYSDEEIAHIYELARFSLEVGEFRRAEIIAHGLVEIAPDFGPGWLCVAFMHLHNRAYEQAIQAAQHALKIDPASEAALLYLVSGYLGAGDFNSAGTHLGELGDLFEAGGLSDPHALRFYRAMLARYQSR
jgi:tetratricopeptide (TPR) repeat protein